MDHLNNLSNLNNLNSLYNLNNLNNLNNLSNLSAPGTNSSARTWLGHWRRWYEFECAHLAGPLEALVRI